MKILVTLDVTPQNSPDPANLLSDITGAVAASVIGIDSVNDVTVAAIETED
jgi:hypothetical protein